jgi:hypothetical protein
MAPAAAFRELRDHRTWRMLVHPAEQIAKRQARSRGDARQPYRAAGYLQGPRPAGSMHGGDASCAIEVL